MLELNLFGDSQIVRFNNYLKNSNKFPEVRIHSVVAKSGISISQLKALIKQQKLSLEHKQINIIFIGTNNITAFERFERIKSDLLSLVAFFKRLLPPSASLVLVEIPLFPKFQGNPKILDLILRVNQLLASIKTDKVIILKWDFQGNIDDYFTQFYRGRKGRIDKIHINRRAFDLLLTSVCDLVNGTKLRKAVRVTPTATNVSGINW